MNDFFTLPTLACLVIGYLLGSIPFALVIGKVFYKTDVRNYGSGNLGGTNAGRVLGAKAGAAVIACDILKVVIAIAFSALISPSVSIWTGLAAAIGHCYPIFAHFKGGKAVATSAGFLLGYNVHFFLICALIFFPILFITSMVSLTSLISVVLIFIASFFFHDLALSIISGLLVILIYWSHRSNIIRIEHHQENLVPFGLVYWYKKKHTNSN